MVYLIYRDHDAHEAANYVPYFGLTPPIVKHHRLQNAVNFKLFECQVLALNATSKDSASVVTFANIYRPPYRPASVSFYDELSDVFNTLGDVIETDRFVAWVTSTTWQLFNVEIIILTKVSSDTFKLCSTLMDFGI